MFDYRYHALSLAAVLLALAVGVLIGVAIGDSNLVSSARDGIVKELRSEVKSSQHDKDVLGEKLSEQERLVGAFWPIAVHGVLAGRSIGLVFLGGSSDQINADVRAGVHQAEGQLKAVVAVREPVDLSGLAGQAAGTRYTALAQEPALIKQFGARIGKQLVMGGQLVQRVRTRLLSSYDGELGGLEGLVVVHNEPTGMEPLAAKATGELESGLIEGALSEEIPVVGVEVGASEPSQVPWYKHERLSSVDDVDSIGGRAALAFALAGHRGTFGVKPSAEAPLPSVKSFEEGA